MMPSSFGKEGARDGCTSGGYWLEATLNMWDRNIFFAHVRRGKEFVQLAVANSLRVATGWP